MQIRPQGVLPSTGLLQVAMTDDVPGVIIMGPPSTQTCHSNCTATSLVVTVTSIEVHTSGIDNMTGEWTAVCINKVPMTLDLVHLQGITQILCGANIKPDTITNVRLTVASANATISGIAGTKSLTVPSGKLEVPLDPVANVEAGKTTTVVVEFQPHIVCTGGGDGNGSQSCKLTPVLHATAQGPA